MPLPNPYYLFMMNNILFWNCRGAGSPKMISHLIDMIKCHRPYIVALMETRVQSSKLTKVLENTYLTNSVAVEARGFAGGIWLAWDKNNVSIEVVSQHDQALNVLVQTDNGRHWFLTVIYASPNLMYQRDLWSYLSRLGSIMTASWVALGDFNQVLEASDKQGGRVLIKPKPAICEK